MINNKNMATMVAHFPRAVLQKILLAKVADSQ